MDIILAITSLCTFVIVVFMLSKLSNYLNEKKKLEYLIPSNLRVDHAFEAVGSSFTTFIKCPSSISTLFLLIMNS